LSRDFGHIKWAGTFGSCGKSTNTMDYGKLYKIMGKEVSMYNKGWYNSSDKTYGFANGFYMNITNTMGLGFAQSNTEDGYVYYLKSFERRGNYSAETVSKYGENLKLKNTKLIMAWTPCGNLGAWLNLETSSKKMKDL